MRAPCQLKQEFLRKWLLSLKICNLTKQNFTILQRKKAIKRSADIAMASTRNGMSYNWRRALVAKASRDDDDNKILVHHMLAYSDSETLKKVSTSGQNMRNKRIRSKKILKKIRCTKRAKKFVLKMAIARKMVKKRTQVLKSLVPGGEFMDDMSLIEETLDYIVSLRAQVDVMRTLAKANGLLNGK
ncbi:transcription factor IBH1-like 1 [Mercurialis annua]|uniref:transcription factor IBH1-like 1 n=1 Tax=Mercurialis annua TaxID=3986 RepID=UPI0021603051|nr:transcription factor IBH1-like 1 [Mercurialis annua]